MEINTTRIEDAIVAEVASKMIGDDDLYQRAKRQIEANIDKLWKETAEAKVRAAIETAIKDGFEREYQRVDSFGGPKGEKTTIRAELEKLIGGYWNTKVDSEGKPSDGYYAKTTRAEWLMAKMCAADFQGEMKQHVVNVGAGLKDSLRNELRGTLDRLLGEVFHVRSASDQAEGRSK